MALNQRPSNKPSARFGPDANKETKAPNWLKWVNYPGTLLLVKPNIVLYTLQTSRKILGKTEATFWRGEWSRFLMYYGSSAGFNAPVIPVAKSDDLIVYSGVLGRVKRPHSEIREPVYGFVNPSLGEQFVLNELGVFQLVQLPGAPEPSVNEEE